MVRKLMAMAAVSGLMLSTALAETNTTADHAAKNAGSVKAITAQQPNQWLGSTLIGMTVVDPDNNTIGEVDDLLVEKDGQIHALIVGVGGFLGIGEKDIALPMSAFSVVPGNTRDAGKAASNNNPPDNANSVGSTSDRLRLSMTKDQLKQHAEFKPASSAQTTGSGASSPSGTAPSERTPANPPAQNR